MAIVQLPDDSLITTVRQAYDDKHAPLTHPDLHIDTKMATPVQTFFSGTTSPATEPCPSFASSQTSPSCSFYSSGIQTPVSPFVVDEPAIAEPVDLAPIRSASFVVPPPTALASSFYARENQQSTALPFTRPSSLTLKPQSAQPEDLLPAARSNWPIGVPKHMLGVFRIFSTAIESGACDNGPARRGKRSATDSPSGTRKFHEKRRRVESLHVPFPATGPLPMFAGEFHVHLRSEREAYEDPTAVSYPMHPDFLNPAYRPHTQQHSISYSELTVGESSPMDVDGPSYDGMSTEYADGHSLNLVYPDCGSYSGPPEPNYHPTSYTGSVGCHIPTPRRLFLPSFSLTDPTYGGFEYPQHQSSPHPYGNSGGRYAAYMPPQLAVAPSTAIPRPHPHMLKSVSLPTMPSDPGPVSLRSHLPNEGNEDPPAGPKRFLLDGQVVYACHLCERTFPFPNGLALHIKWHGKMRARESAANQANDPPSSSTVSRSGSLEWSVVATHSVKDAHYGATDSTYVPAHVDSNAAAYTPQEYMLSHSDAYPSMAQRNDDSALFLQNSHFGTPNVYLAPLQGVPVLAPLPFSQNPWGHEGQY